MINVQEILEEAMVEHVTPTFPGSPHRAITAVRWYLNNDPDCKKGLMLGIQKIVEELLKEASNSATWSKTTIWAGLIPAWEINQQSILDTAKSLNYD